MPKDISNSQARATLDKFLKEVKDIHEKYGITNTILSSEMDWFDGKDEGSSAGSFISGDKCDTYVMAEKLYRRLRYENNIE